MCNSKNEFNIDEQVFFTFLCFRRCNDGGLVPEEEGGRKYLYSPIQVEYQCFNMQLTKKNGPKKSSEREKVKIKFSNWKYVELLSRPDFGTFLQNKI